MAVEHLKLATQVKILERLLDELKQTLAAAQPNGPSSFLRYKGALRGWLAADDELLEDCRLKFNTCGSS